MTKKVMGYGLWVMGSSFLLCLAYNSSLITYNYCYAQPTSSTELVNNAKQYEGKGVTYEGEVIGDIMVRGQYVWLNVHDGKNALGVWIDKSLVQDIAYTGSYRARGDWVEISGVFQRACAQHGGDLDIHAKAIQKKNPGRQRAERLSPGKKRFAIILSGILCLVWILELFKQR